MAWIARAVGDADSVAEVRLGVNPAGDALTGKASLDADLRLLGSFVPIPTRSSPAWLSVVAG